MLGLTKQDVLLNVNTPRILKCLGFKCVGFKDVIYLAGEDCLNKLICCWFPQCYNLVPVTQDCLIWAAV